MGGASGGSRRVHREDRGLVAVRRVREVRETDSRLGMRIALEEEARADARHSALTERLGSADVPAISTPAALVAFRQQLLHLGTAMVDARGEADGARAIAADARARWQADRARLAAVDHLLARRAELRRTEAERRTAKEADDLATQRWLRGRPASAGGEHA